MNIAAWIIAVLLSVGLVLEGGYGSISYFGASMLAFFNADPSMGTVDNTYARAYFEAWAESKVGK